ncbi:hypothetical protein ACHQM5_022864 [Ranunculus cassubicifolius]
MISDSKIHHASHREEHQKDCSSTIKKIHSIEQSYTFGKKIGIGSYGCVRICKNKKLDKQFACKTITKADACFRNEVEIMKHLNGGHPGIVSLKDFYEDSQSFHLVMEFCSLGHLKRKRLSERKAACLIKDLMSAVKYCHEKGVVHRDIKPENVLFTESKTLKLADFGEACRYFEGKKLMAEVGTPAYTAPEVLSGRGYTDKVDIWSAGVVLYELLTGEVPFEGDSFEVVSQEMRKKRLDLTTGRWKYISPPARDLVGKMLCAEVSLRLSADQVLNHPWISILTQTTQY